MKSAGFQEVRIGFESSLAGFHDVFDEKFRPAQFFEAVEMLENAGFHGKEIRAYVLAGMPGQYREEAEEAVEDAAEAGVWVSLARYSPVPGSSLWKEGVELSRYPLEEEPLFHNNTFFSMEWDRFTREDLRRLHDRAVSLNHRLAGE